MEYLKPQFLLITLFLVIRYVVKVVITTLDSQSKSNVAGVLRAQRIIMYIVEGLMLLSVAILALLASNLREGGMAVMSLLWLITFIVIAVSILDSYLTIASLRKLNPEGNVVRVLDSTKLTVG